MRRTVVPVVGLGFASLIAVAQVPIAPAPRAVAPATAKSVGAAPVPAPAAKPAPPGAVPPGAVPVGPDGAPAAPALPPPTPVQALIPTGPAVVEAIEKGPRMQRLKSLTFDRRPGAILKAWNPKPKDAEKDKDGKEEPPAGDDNQPQFQRPGMVIEEGDSPQPPGGPAAKKGKKTPEQVKLDAEIEAYQSAVALSKWDVVKTYYDTLYKQEAKAAYAQLLKSLANPPMDMNMMQRGGMPIPPQAIERNVFFTNDLMGLAALAPADLDKPQVKSLAAMLRQAVTNGVAIEHVVGRLQEEVKAPKPTLTARQCARMLADAGHLLQVGKFLPEPDGAMKEKDLEALNLLARHYLEKHATDKKSPFLEKAWEATLNILALDGPRAEKDEAIKRAVELQPRVRAELGDAWLDDSFNKNPARGMDILATLGGMVSQGIATHPFDTDYRNKELNLQKAAVDALLKASPAKADEWKATLTLLAGNWLREAEYTRQYDRSTGGSRMQRDYYGNFYYGNPDDDGQEQQNMFLRQQGFPFAVKTGEMLKTAPSTEWLKRVDDGLRPKLSDALARLHLKVNDEEKAFPFIEQMAPTHPTQAKELVKEFFRVWTRTHDPNAAKNEYRNSWIYFYGFETRAESIPLTRSKQERNLVELGEWVARVKKLPLGDPDEDMVSKAFTACHSSAEVFKMEAVEKVFGDIKKVKPKTLAALGQTMRANLAGLWRLPSEQEKKKTKRKQKDIETEVRQGYATALATVENGIQKFPDDWSLTLAKAALLHDRTAYENELAKDSKFTARRSGANELFAKAAEQYAKLVATRTLSEDEESTAVYDQWFYASLGAVDLGTINEDKVPDLTQPPFIRKALTALPSDAAKRHMDKFANALFTRMSTAKPQIKFRYLKAGFQIVDPDHRQAAEAKKVYDYYKDLVSEIHLVATVDGSTVVGHGQPFGVFVNIRHTRDIERESGGFGRYLQNQNSLTYSYNYGRPTADYRDRFETQAKDALKEQFDVVSVTFQTESVHARADREYGWRVTPYAYLLLKPRGPQVDKIAPMRLDLDFLDTSGYVVLPVESPAVPVDCKADKPDARPLKKLNVVQTLDERQADKGKLLLEIKASGVGLVGGLDDLATVTPAGFEVKKIDDNGVAVTKFDEDGDAIAVVSERNWTVALEAIPGQAPPKEFKFAALKATADEATFQRYKDADVLQVTDTISLDKEYGKAGWGLKQWLVLTAGVGGLVIVLVGAALMLRKKPVATGPSLPADVTPFTVVEILNRAKRSGKLSAAQIAEVDRAIAELETHYFAADRNGTATPDLRKTAEKWLASV